jgi:ATP phosphoribosyltransferase
MSRFDIESPIKPSDSLENLLEKNRELLERFQATKMKIAVQKDGALTGISREILRDTCGISVPPAPEGRVPVGVSEDGEIGFIYARNKSICDLITEGAADIAVVGTDRLIEDGAEERVDIIASYRDRFAWSLVLATPADSSITRPEELSKVATQYPTITARYFENIGLTDIEITRTTGGTELYPYLEHGSRPIDAVVDLTATGESLAAHNMVPWTPAIGQIYPVLIQKRQSTEQDPMPPDTEAWLE